jgi:hypothetical protein
MRTLLTVSFEVIASNKAITEGSFAKIMESIMEKLKPEASYFTTRDGCRTAYIVFDLKDPSDMPVIAEPLFMGMNAKVDFSPVMNAEDLQKGLAQLENLQGK